MGTIRELLEETEEEGCDLDDPLRIEVGSCCGSEYFDIISTDFEYGPTLQISVGSCRALGSMERCKIEPLLEKLLEKVVDSETLAILLTSDQDKDLRDYVTKWAKRSTKQKSP